MLIQIERCSLPFGWYKDLVPSVIEVDYEDTDRYYSIKDKDWYVLKKDCRLISTKEKEVQ